MVPPQGFNASVEVRLKLEFHTSFNASEHISNFDETLTRTTENFKQKITSY